MHLRAAVGEDQRLLAALAELAVGDRRAAGAVDQRDVVGRVAAEQLAQRPFVGRQGWIGACEDAL
jgi:hypothetical protein